MVLFSGSTSFGRKGFQQACKLPLSSLLLYSSHVTAANIGKQNFLYFINFAVVYMVQPKRQFKYSAALNLENNTKKTSFLLKTTSNEMCPLHSQNNNILFEKYKSSYTSGSKKYYRDALFVLGPMGSGKTTVIRDKILTHGMYKNYAYVDTDEIMEQLPGFNKLQVNNFYPAARQIAIKLTDWLLNHQLSFVAEGTCVKYEELLDYMIRLKRKGYSIKVCKLTNVDMDLVLKRASSRETRKMKIDTVKDIFIQSNYGLQELYKTNEETTIFENINVEDLS